MGHQQKKFLGWIQEDWVTSGKEWIGMDGGNKKAIRFQEEAAGINQKDYRIFQKVYLWTSKRKAIVQETRNREQRVTEVAVKLPPVITIQIFRGIHASKALTFV